MDKFLNKFFSLIILFSFFGSCQKKEVKKIENVFTENNVNSSFEGKWILVHQEDDHYYHCEDDVRFIEISKNKVHDHTPMEDSHFKVDHISNNQNSTFFYLDTQEKEFYRISWLDKNNGVISVQLNMYQKSIFINAEKLANLKTKICEPKSETCEYTNLSNRYKFSIEAGEYSDDKNKKYPISAWIIVTKKTNGKAQEIHYEPNSWKTFSRLPCDEFFIKDYNFDGLEDFAIVWDDGGNSGKLFEYYFQNNRGEFEVVDSFPLQRGPLPDDYNFQSKTLDVKSIVGCCNYNRYIYRLKEDGTWEISSKQHKLNEK